VFPDAAGLAAVMTPDRERAVKKIVLAGWSVMILVGCTAQPGKDELRMSNP
jgi:hypothetical protein